MPRAHVVRQSHIARTPRVMQLEGLFDLKHEQISGESWDVDFELPEQWNVGVIVGPSGSGKTTIAREFFGEHIVTGYEWSQDQSIVDDFPKDCGIKDITGLLSSVGFSSPRSWLRPFHALSNGEQFRVTIARALAENAPITVIDEFTSVVDRTVAQIGSAAVAKTVRRRNQKLIAVSCHYDILDWLEPDWVYLPAENRLYAGRSVHQRPVIDLVVRRVHSSAWAIFSKHHYLDHSCATSARCFVAFWNDRPVAFTAWLHFPHPRVSFKREHRTVVLPDFQGVGIGNALADHIASALKAMGHSARTTTTHPARIAALNRSRNWVCKKKPQFNQTNKTGMRALAKTHATSRLTAAFEYVGPAMARADAIALWGDVR